MGGKQGAAPTKNGFSNSHSEIYKSLSAPPYPAQMFCPPSFGNFLKFTGSPLLGGRGEWCLP